ncbi:hypothetical protein [Pseudomonas subflava]|uniref:hypothetical protein n=1 Tax=Pseudomonas subflava TaxID=2952933 RepID=UPI00207A46F2|nr:hypothetical protein [Pseudomonas subflava]
MTDIQMIPAQPRRALLRMLPWAVLVLPFLALALWLRFGGTEVCAPQLFGIPRAYLALLVATLGMPLLILAFTLAQIPYALKILRQGYFPPLDAVRLRATQARRGPLTKVRGYLMLAAPLLVVGILFIGHDAYRQVMQGRSAADLQRAIEADCRDR